MDGPTLSPREVRWLRWCRIVDALEEIERSTQALGLVFCDAELKGRNGKDLGRAAAHSLGGLNAAAGALCEIARAMKAEAAQENR